MPKVKRLRPLRKPPPPLEKTIQRQIVQYLRLRGFYVYETSQGFRREGGGTRTTPGFPDLMAMVTGWPSLLFIEVKRPGGAVRPAQQQFRERAFHCNQTYLLAYSLDDVRTFLGDTP